MIRQPLDLTAVQAFIHIAELGSFTRAAEMLGTTQSAVSLKLKRLEDRLGQRLMDRTPRHVALTARGVAFLDHARALMTAQDRALQQMTATRQRLVIGISDHVAGPDLPRLISRMNRQDPDLLIDIRIGSSADLLQAYDRRELDAAIVRLQAGRSDGELVAEEPFRWFAGPGWQHRPGEPLPIATMPEPCGVRALAAQLLDEAGHDWAEVFSGGGVAAVTAAIMADLGIAALAPRLAPLGAVDVGKSLDLPALPRLPILLHARATDPRPRAALDTLTTAFRHGVG